jgi:hypothetical protein
VRVCCGRADMLRTLSMIADELGHAEVEQLGQQTPRALDDHDVRRLEVAVHDARVVRALDDLRDALEQRHELLGRQRAALVEPARKRRPVHHLHRDPEQPVDLDPECIDVRRVRMVEPRGELGLAQEPPHDGLVVAQPLVQHLDHRSAPERLLLTAVDRPVAALTDPLADDELADRAPAHAIARSRAGRHQAKAPDMGDVTYRARGMPVQTGQLANTGKRDVEGRTTRIDPSTTARHRWPAPRG